MTDIDTIDSAWRENEVLNDPGTGKYKPLKAPQRRVLKRIESSVNKGLVAKATKALLEPVLAAKPDDTPGLVYGDPAKANNGWYTVTGGEVTQTQKLGAGIATVENIGGTANAITGDTAGPIDPAEIQLLILPDPPGTNTSQTVTIALNGGTVEDIKAAAGGNVALGDIIAGVGTVFFRFSAEWRQLFSSATGTTFDHQGAWVVDRTYIKGQVVTGSNNHWYQVKVPSSLGDDPVGSVTGDWLDLGALGIPAGAVGSTEMADGSVNESKHADGGVSTRALAGNAVEESKLSRSVSARTGALFDAVADLLADTTLTYVSLAENDIVTADWHRYRVAASAAADHHVETAGGLKLYALPGNRGYAAPAFGAIGDGTVSQVDMYTRLSTLWDRALADGQDMYFPAGLYEIGDANLPFRNPVNTSLLDCKNITICGDGDTTIFRTVSPDGADAFQLNALKNLRLRDFCISPTLTGLLGSGSNGISVTNGYDNIVIDNVFILNAPSVDAGVFVDGGKALSIQPVTTANECGALIARNIRAKGCSYAFGMDINLNTMAFKKTSVSVDIEAEDCFRAVVISAGAATSALTRDFDLGISVKGHAVNCQQDVVLSRAHGIRCDMTLVTTKTAAARRLNPDGVAWQASATEVEALLSAYAQNAWVRIAGNKGECDYKARIGGTTVGASGLTGRTLNSYFELDIGGDASTGDIVAVNSGGVITSDCVFVISPRSMDEFGVDTLLTDPSYNNEFPWRS